MRGVAGHIRQPLLESKGSAEIENADHKHHQQRQRHRELHDLGGSIIVNQSRATHTAWQMDSMNHGLSSRTCADAFK
jgi:hypothetical protein